MMKTEHELLDE